MTSSTGARPGMETRCGVNFIKDHCGSVVREMSGYSQQRRILLHIGWPKTGTTTLQKHGLNRVSNYRYLGKVPLIYKKNIFFFDFVHLIAYASVEKFEEEQASMLQRMVDLEKELFQDVDPSIPAILSEESFLSCLLKPSDHQHHGISTASLSGIIDRFSRLQILWNVTFDFLITEREPFELLHSYYAQSYHIIRHFKGLDSFQGYIANGTRNSARIDLGFRYLKPGMVTDAFVERFGRTQVHTIGMHELFSSGKINLNIWHPTLPMLELGEGELENRRAISKDIKVAHLRPYWVPKTPFKLRKFLSIVKELYLVRHGSHEYLEVHIQGKSAEREKLQDFLCS